MVPVRVCCTHRRADPKIDLVNDLNQSDNGRLINRQRYIFVLKRSYITATKSIFSLNNGIRPINAFACSCAASALLYGRLTAITPINGVR